MEGAGLVEVEGLRARLLVVGEGPPVVVLHGWGGRIESMAPVVLCLKRDFRVVALDLPGFGESPAPPTVWGSPEYAGYVRAVLSSRGIERAHFVGHSFGAKTALQIAARWPEAVDRLVAVGSPGLRTPPSLVARGKRLISKGAGAAGRLGPPGRRLKDAVYARVASQDYREAGAMRPILVRAVNEDLSDLLPRVTAPTLLVWGGEDDATPVAQGKTMADLIPDAGLVCFEGAGHFAYLDEPDRFCRIVRNFFGAKSQ